jgi:glycine cleavage system H protein
VSSIPDSLRYSTDHEWVELIKESEAACGITDHAQNLLTDIVFVELPDVGNKVEKGDQIAVVESVKAVSDVYSPMSGTITEVNLELEDSPEYINTDPYGKGWIFKIEINDKKEYDDLMDSSDYNNHVEAGEN